MLSCHIYPVQDLPLAQALLCVLEHLYGYSLYLPFQQPDSPLICGNRDTRASTCIGGAAGDAADPLAGAAELVVVGGVDEAVVVVVVAAAEAEAAVVVVVVVAASAGSRILKSTNDARRNHQGKISFLLSPLTLRRPSASPRRAPARPQGARPDPLRTGRPRRAASTAAGSCC